MEREELIGEMRHYLELLEDALNDFESAKITTDEFYDSAKGFIMLLSKLIEEL